MKKELRFGFMLMAIMLAAIAVFMPWGNLTSGHLGLLMLALVVVMIMLGFPTAFTLMGMGMVFGWLSYRSVNPDIAVRQTLDLMVQRTYGVMTNDVLISIPLFVFMGYLVERANLIEKLFKSLHLALARIPGSLAVATLVTCAIFATATGIVGAVVTLMGLLALPAMLRAGYNVKLSAGVITAGGCLGILIPPSVLLIVYGATAGVSVVKLYAGAFFPGLMLALLYVGYVMIVAKLKPEWAPPLPESERKVKLPAHTASIASRFGDRALPALFRAALTRDGAGATKGRIARELFTALLPAIVFAIIMGLAWNSITRPDKVTDISGLQEMGMVSSDPMEAPGLNEPQAEGVQEPPTGPVAESLQEAPAPTAQATAPSIQVSPSPAAVERLPTPSSYWKVLAGGIAVLASIYALFSFARLEIFKMLLTSFFPLVVMILAVLGSIVFGLATPTEAAAIGSFGGFVLAAMYLALRKSREERRKLRPTWMPLWLAFAASVVWFLLFKAGMLPTAPPDWLGWLSMAAIGVWCVLAVHQVQMLPTVRESAFLTAKTSAMVCWLFVGSSIFSAAFALLGGQGLVEHWVLSMNLTPLQFMLLSQAIIFILGWPLEWTEIIVIFMPIFIPLLAHFNIDPLFFGLLVALNLQTAFLSPPVAMAAFYLKGVSPPHVTLNQIFAGMMPFMAIQVLAMFLLYMWPQIGLWLPSVMYK
ncbi:TRAP transporter large permease [Thiobacillus denitrificans]|uniref:C4-dicarboxylate ABC transporter n=1 Tax=Thiobacillus denitrificans TaxID=36861 RepID=A0A106BN92_THIDE|nr:TRAP transporter large permease subunit [Thiobacillus denitrificans]KVW95587.1 C4-dicarboxylate ABC transporter [Thiobacillus denitrificans]